MISKLLQIEYSASVCEYTSASVCEYTKDIVKQSENRLQQHMIHNLYNKIDIFYLLYYVSSVIFQWPYYDSHI